jgi:hypothetical protein
MIATASAYPAIVLDADPMRSAIMLADAVRRMLIRDLGLPDVGLRILRRGRARTDAAMTAATLARLPAPAP